MKKKIIIGGVAGTGKTTLAKQLCQEFDIVHRLGTGFIREIVKSEKYRKALDCHTYRVSCQSPYNHLMTQTYMLKKAINACIDRAHKEGTSIIIEGNHCIPWILENPNITDTFILYIENKDIHKVMLYGKTHLNRKITDEQFKMIREMQESLIHLANLNKIPLIEADEGEFKTFEKIRKLI